MCRSLKVLIPPTILSSSYLLGPFLKNVINVKIYCRKKTLCWQHTSESTIRVFPLKNKLIQKLLEKLSFISCKISHSITQNQFNIMLVAITGVVRDSSRKKPYQELALETLQHRPWFRKLCTFQKVYKDQSPRFFYKELPL